MRYAVISLFDNTWVFESDDLEEARAYYRMEVDKGPHALIELLETND